MSKNIDIKLNSVHAVWGIFIWKSPVFIGLICLIAGGLSLVPYVSENHEEQSTKMANFNELVRRCEQAQMEETGSFDSLLCKKWANTYYRVYSF